VGDERIRLFCALQLPPETVSELAVWQAENLLRGRIVPPDNLHVTLAFLGSRPAGEVPAIAHELREASAGAPAVLPLRIERYRETRGVGMLVLEDASGAATALAEDVQGRLERLGAYRREARPWLPHLTVLRFRERAGLAPPGTNTCSIDVVRTALYSSALGPSGARYHALETVALGGR
jgi:RNA 2',3'-cyclic 3'-phosphodiesterase